MHLTAFTKSALGSVFSRITNCGVSGNKRLRRVMAHIVASEDCRAKVETAHGPFSLRTTSEIECYRVDTFFSKEPETLRWIEETITGQSVFYDVGANVGLYSLYASLVGGKDFRAYCFEPAGTNFRNLCRNIDDNDFGDLISPFPMALSNQIGVINFPLSDMAPGSALHGEAQNQDRKPALVQGAVVMPLDYLLQEHPAVFAPPTHLKIDVDGPELEIIEGARETLRQPSLRHVLVETEEHNNRAITDILIEAGFSLKEKFQQAPQIHNCIFEKN
ncbi:FkbM family methyltransferase [Kiloniella laminariae]|uniref:FkbM family methyltransferase n=1 Tax=Kiloniella laminariae TaxID=454162 RepID=UPI00038293B0|nr:FkbM family methyltransferase [Kiloniella laminariae]